MNKEERCSRVPRLSDTRYSAKLRYASSKALWAFEWAWQIFFGAIDRYWRDQYISVKFF